MSNANSARRLRATRSCRHHLESLLFRTNFDASIGSRYESPLTGFECDMSIEGNNSAEAAPVRFQWIGIAAVALLIATVSTIYGVRLSRLPIVGEESRWGTAAREMLASGDWIVTRQQGHVFSERPPMTVWAIAAVGWLCGEVDPIAVRLPSVIAVVLTTLLIYGYARMCLSQFAAWTGALVYASMAQVVQIGRMGESEALSRCW